MAAGYETTYVLDKDGGAWACGWNVYGQLGAAEQAHSAGGYPALRRVRAGGQDAAPAEPLMTIAAGAYHALARNRNGELLAWGHNGFGQLGDGTDRDRDTVVPAVALRPNFAPEPLRQPAGLAPPAPDVELRSTRIGPEVQTVLNVRERGAFGDGVHLDQAPLQRAIDAVHEAGGGVVRLPAGTYRTGTLHLRSGVRLHLEQGATILGSTNRQHYQSGASRPGVITAQGAQNIAVTGSGVIDGQGQFCPNRGWRHRILSIDHSTHVTIEGCIVASEDDGIVIKSQSADLVNRNIRAINNTVYTMCNAFKLGTETRGDFENIVCEDLRAFGGSTLAVWSVAGSRVSDVRIANVRAVDSRFGLGIRLGARLRESYFGEGEQRVPGSMEDVVMRDIDIRMAEGPFRDVLLEHGIENAEVAHQLWLRPAETSFVSGLPEHPVRNVLLEDVRISYPGGGTQEESQIEVPERATVYPNAGMFGRLPAWGLYLRDAQAVTLRDWRLVLQTPDGRPPVMNQNLEETQLVIEGLEVCGPRN
jgi:hypothetical protein